MANTEQSNFKPNDFDYNNFKTDNDPKMDPFGEFNKTLGKVATLAIGSMMVKALLEFTAKKFFESYSLPVKVTYVDWWPRTCQKVKEFGSKFWSRRLEGATATTISTLGLAGLWAYSDLHPAANSLWSVIGKTTQSFLGLFGFKGGFGLGSAFDVLWTLPSMIGLGTSLTLGSWDLISKYYDRDKVLETKPVFNEKLQAELDDILSAARSIKEDNGFFQNLLLYGPPGTGKTMISKWIAANSNMNYILMSGGDLLKTANASTGKDGVQSGAGAAVATLQKLIEHATSLTSPTVIFIDEAEACFAKRDGNNKSQELVSLLNAFLELTGQPSSKMMLVLATNRSKDLDPAVLSRMDHKIYVGPPELAERKSIIEGTLSILVNSPEDRAHFTPSMINHIAKQTQGLSGRDIFKLCNRLKIEVRQKKSLSTASVDKMIGIFVKQEQQIENQNDSKNHLQSNPFYSQKAAG